MSLATQQGSFLPYSRHAVDDDDVAAVVDVLRGDWLTTGPAVQAFEDTFAAVVGAEHAIACSSGTAALHLACLALGIGPGDHVVVPAISFVATANAARLAGADVIFCDVSPDTGLMGVGDLRQALTSNSGKRIKAVFVVHLNGQPAPMEAISKLARDHKLSVVEDACHGIGTTFSLADGATAKVGDCRFSDLSTFSFHAVKTIAMGEGGGLTTNRADLAEKLARLRNHGIVRDETEFLSADNAFDGESRLNPWYYEMQELGLNYRITDIQCALGLSQCEKLGRTSDRRRHLMRLYDEALKDLAPAVAPVKRVKGCDPVLHLYPVLIDFGAVGVGRAELMERLAADGIGTQVHFIPIHRHPYYSGLYGWQSFPGSESYYDRTLSLPFFPAMRDDDVGRVAAALTQAIGI